MTADEKKAQVLSLLKKHYGSISHACAEAQVAKWTYFEWKRSDSEFSKAATEIQEVGLEQLLSKFRK